MGIYPIKLLAVIFAIVASCGPYEVYHSGEVTYKIDISDVTYYFEVMCQNDPNPEECVADMVTDFLAVLEGKPASSPTPTPVASATPAPLPTATPSPTSTPSPQPCPYKSKGKCKKHGFID